ncbi:MAG: Gfo/Idh/MocA family oxidoreductase [Anaerolineaceae bacterium]
MEILSSFQNPGGFFKKEELNWGVLGTARIAEKSVIPAIKATKNNNVVAVASRNLTRASEFAQAMEIPKAYGSYDELLADPNVQAVYIPLPNSEHAPWAIKAMEAGKHVLVEKPFALNADEAQLMISTSLEHSVVLVEGFMYRYNSRFNKIMELIRHGNLGKLRFIESSFSFALTNPDDIRLTSNLGGGVLYDLGCYCVNFQRLLVGREPKLVQALCHEGNTGVDLQMTATMDFGELVYTHFDIAFNAAGQQSTRITGTEGVLEINQPFNTNGEGTQAWLTKSGETKKLSFRGEDDYRKMVEHFYYVVVSKEAPLFPLSDALNNMVVMDALYQSAIDGGRLVSL